MNEGFHESWQDAFGGTPKTSLDVATLAETGHVTMETRDNVLSYIEMETDFGPNYAYQQCASGGFEVEEFEARWRI